MTSLLYLISGGFAGTFLGIGLVYLFVYGRWKCNNKVHRLLVDRLHEIIKDQELQKKCLFKTVDLLSKATDRYHDAVGRYHDAIDILEEVREMFEKHDSGEEWKSD